MAVLRILLVLLIFIFDCALGCRTPSKPFVTNNGAIATCTNDGECPSLFECRLLWLGVRICCSLPFASSIMVDQKSIDQAAPNGILSTSLVDQIGNPIPVGESSDYYYVYMPSTDPPVEKSWPSPNLALTNNLKITNPKIQAHQFQLGKGSKDGYTSLNKNNYHLPMIQQPSYHYAPFSASIFDIFNLGSNRKLSSAIDLGLPYPDSIYQIPPVSNPYQYGSYLSNVGVSKKSFK